MYSELKQIIESSHNIVFFGGAGTSTESGIPDFRSEDGIYNTYKIFGKSAEYLLSHRCFEKEPELFYRFYKAMMIYPDAKPNQAHKALAKLEKQGKLKALITQNIDTLHEMAGSQNVLKVHGTIADNFCEECGEWHDLDYIIAAEGMPRCHVCQGILKPAVVLYDEALDWDLMDKAKKAISEAEVLIVGGTSLMVQPAASLIDYFKGKYLIMINKGETPYDRKAYRIIRENMGEVLGNIIGE